MGSYSNTGQGKALPIANTVQDKVRVNGSYKNCNSVNAPRNEIKIADK